MNFIDWSKAPFSATHYNPHGRTVYWYRNPGNWEQLKAGRWVKSHDKQKVLDRLVAKPKAMTEWNGEGFPPAGIEAEYSNGSGWSWCEVVGIHKGEVVAATEYGGLISVIPGLVRPVRTKEQVAAAEREKAIKWMQHASGSANRWPFEQLYDAGCRQVVDV